MVRKVVSGIMLTLLLISMLTLAFDIQPVWAETRREKLPVVYVDPPVSVANPGETFTIDIKVTGVSADRGVSGWQFMIMFDFDILYTRYDPLHPDDPTKTWIWEGDFLKNVGPTMFIVARKPTGWLIGCCLRTPVTASGSGTLATIKFQVVGKGKTSLHLPTEGYFRTKLIDIDIRDIDHTVEDGLFYTTVPFASFVYSPSMYWEWRWPIVGETVTFDATDSYDPDNGNGRAIVSYTWDFDDGTPVVVETEQVINHTYTNEGLYEVTLTITDNDGETCSTWQPLLVHDIVVTDVKVSQTAVHAGDPLTVDVTVANLGLNTETFNVTLHLRAHIKTLSLSLDGESAEILTFTLNTDSLLGPYRILIKVEEFIDPGQFVEETLYWNLEREIFVIPPGTLIATTQFEPETLKKKSQGEWITCYVELSEGYNPADIDVSNTSLGLWWEPPPLIIPAELKAADAADFDNDGIPDLAVKFDRDSVIEFWPPWGTWFYFITGLMFDGTPFLGFSRWLTH